MSEFYIIPRYNQTVHKRIVPFAKIVEGLHILNRWVEEVERAQSGNEKARIITGGM